MGLEELWREQEPALVERAKHDADAFGELYIHYAVRIYAFAYARLHSRAEAEDATSDVFLRALGGIARYRNMQTPFSAWLYRIAANVIITRHHLLLRTVALEDVSVADQSPDVVDLALARESVRIIWAAVDTLPRRQRIAVTLRFSADLSYSAIAAIVGKSGPATKQLIHRGVGSVRARLGGAPFDGRAVEGDLGARFV